MKVTLAPSSMGEERQQYLSTFLLGRGVAVDAGSLGIFGSVEEQVSIEHVFLTHSHADHVATLPIFLENTSHLRQAPVHVYGSVHTLNALREHVFNDQIWPNLGRLNGGNCPLVDLVILESEQAVEVRGLRIKPVTVNHTVPTFGYLIEDDRAAVIMGADSGPTHRLWDLGRAAGKLRTAFLECTYPDGMREHAERTGHLTPALLQHEASNLPPETEIVAVHIRPTFRERVEGQLQGLSRGGIRVGRSGESYSY